MHVDKMPQTLNGGLTITANVIGGKWKPCIIDCIANGINRPARIQKAIRQVGIKVIREQLSELVDYEILSKEVFEGYPLRVEYKLTSFGSTLITVIDAMQKWGDIHSEKVTEIAIKKK